MRYTPIKYFSACTTPCGSELSSILALVVYICLLREVCVKSVLRAEEQLNPRAFLVPSEIFLSEGLFLSEPAASFRENKRMEFSASNVSRARLARSKRNRSPSYYSYVMP